MHFIRLKLPRRRELKQLDTFSYLSVIAMKAKMKVRGLNGLNDDLFFAPRLLRSQKPLTVHQFIEQQQ